MRVREVCRQAGYSRGDAIRDLVSMMVGREIQTFTALPARRAAEEYFRVDGLTRDRFFGISRSVYKVGKSSGLPASSEPGARKSAVRSLELTPLISEEIFRAPTQVHSPTPLSSIGNGIAYLTEDRKGQGLFLGMSIRENIVAPLWANSWGGAAFWTADALTGSSATLSTGTSSQPRPSTKKLNNLSGGNQQKCLS